MAGGPVGCPRWRADGPGARYYRADGRGCACGRTAGGGAGPGGADALARAVTSPYDQAQALTELATAAAQAGDLDRAGRLFGRPLVTNPLKISRVETVCRLFPSVLENTLDIRASAYAIPD